MSKPRRKNSEDEIKLRLDNVFLKHQLSATTQIHHVLLQIQGYLSVRTLHFCILTSLDSFVSTVILVISFLGFMLLVFDTL